MVVLGGGLIYYLQKGKSTTNTNKDKGNLKEKDSPNKGNSKSSADTPAPKIKADTPIADNGIPIRKADRETIKLVQTDLNRIAMFTLQKPIKVDGVWGKQTQQFAINVIGRDIADMTYAAFVNRNASATNTVAGSANAPANPKNTAKHIINLVEEAHFDIEQNAQDQELYARINKLSDEALRQFVAYWKSQYGTNFNEKLKLVSWKWSFGTNYGNLLRGTLNKLKL